MKRHTAVMVLALAALAACASPPAPTPTGTGSAIAPATAAGATPSAGAASAALIVQRQDLSIAVRTPDGGTGVALPPGAWYAAAAADDLLLLLDAAPDGRRVVLVRIDGDAAVSRGEWRMPRAAPANGCLAPGGRAAVGDIDSGYWLLDNGGAISPLELGRGHSDACAWLDGERLVVKSTTGDRLTMWQDGRAAPVAVRAESPSVGGGRLAAIDRANPAALVLYDIGDEAVGAARPPLHEVARAPLLSADESLFDPAVAPDGRTVLVTINRAEGARLARYEFNEPGLDLVGEEPRPEDIRWYGWFAPTP